jgi:hypothetical protein
MSSTDKDVVERFHAIVQCGRVNGPYKQGTNKPKWVWNASSREDFASFAKLIGPWLCERRTRQLAATIDTWEAGPRRGKLTDEAIESIRAVTYERGLYRSLAAAYGVQAGTIGKIRKGIQHKPDAGDQRVKLDAAKVAAIRAAAPYRGLLTDLAQEYQVSATTIRNVRNRRTWTVV